jgi:hypothetical protein
VALAVTAAVALWPVRWRVVPTDEGAWRGLSDPPGLLRLALAALLGFAAAAVLTRAPPGARRAVLALGLAALPIVPVSTGRLLPLLALQGPVLVLVFTAVAAVVAVRLLSTAPGRGAAVPPALLFAAGFAFFALLSTRMPGPAGPQGDEPQYVLLAHSLLSDADVDLADEFAGRDYAAFFSGTLEPHTSPFSRAPHAYSIHTPGLPLLILPGYALAGYAGVRLTLCAFVALAAMLVQRVVRRRTGDERLALGAWGLLVFAPPLPFYAMRVYPETPAVLAAAVFLWARATGGPLAAGAAMAAAAVLPWVHPKLFLLSALGLAVTFVRPGRWAGRAGAVAVLALSMAALLLHFHAQFGRASLHGGFPATNLDLALLPRGLLAVLFDRQFGLLAVAPALALAVPGLWWSARRRDLSAAPAALIAGLFLVLSGAFRFWWGGACPPARYVLPAVPALGVLLAPALGGRPGLAAALGGLGLGIVGLAAEAPRIVHNRADGESLLLRFLSPSFDLNALLPSFFDEGFAPVALAAACAAALGAAWRWRWAGALGGAAAVVLTASAVSDRPRVDRRLATLDVLWDWQPGRLTGPAGPPDLATLALPLELPRAPWTFAERERRNSRRMDVPPGRYTFVVSLVPSSQPGRLRVELGSAPLVFAETVLSAEQGQAALPVLLPAGARRLGVSALGLAGWTELAEARLVPEALVPRDARGRFGWPEFAEPARYRTGGPVRVTALDRSVPEGGGFRLEREQGDLLVDGARDAVARVQVRRERPMPTDALEWAGRTLRLGPHADVALHLPLREGTLLGGEAVVPLRLRAPRAWIRVSEAR